MNRTRKSRPGKRWTRKMRIGAGAVFILLLCATVALAQFVLTAKIYGNTVNYSAFGADPDADYKVTITHDDTNQSNSYGEHSNEEGEFEGSGTPGNSPIEPGDSVTVSVYDAEGNQIASVTLYKKGAPWWAYTGIGTIVWWLT